MNKLSEFIQETIASTVIGKPLERIRQLTIVGVSVGCLNVYTIYSLVIRHNYVLYKKVARRFILFVSGVNKIGNIGVP